jgi:hypothetical protein
MLIACGLHADCMLLHADCMVGRLGQRGAMLIASAMLIACGLHADCMLIASAILDQRCAML